MKRYYVEYWNNFGNTYNLYWAETPEQIEKAEKFCERISRKDAEKLCTAENYRRKHDNAFSGFAMNFILPIDYEYEDDWRNDKRVYLDGYTVLYK